MHRDESPGRRRAWRWAGSSALFFSAVAMAQGTCEKPVYLTFDTGHMGVAPLVADVLRRQEVRVTFFASAEATQTGGDSLDNQWAPWWKARAAEGHEFASHTHDHVYWRGDEKSVEPRFRVRPSAGALAGREFTWDAATYCANLRQSSDRLALVTGQKPLPLFRAPLSPLLTVLSMVPPLAILPILFIVFGLGELSKVMLIVIGITPVLARDLEQRAREIPPELLIKAQTLGASTWTLILRVVLPQLLPRLLIALRLVLGSAWLFLIAAEAIASTDGLGYRIFLVRRYLAMDVILPYVAWITLLAWLMDLGLRRLTQLAFPWFEGSKA